MFGAIFPKGICKFQTPAQNSVQAVLYRPFDLARENYSRAVRAGLIERSMLASAKFCKTLGHMETMALGPFARRR